METKTKEMEKKIQKILRKIDKYSEKLRSNPNLSQFKKIIIRIKINKANRKLKSLITKN
jgi:hypothetical protein